MITRTVTMEITHREAGIMLFLLAGMLGKLRCAPSGSTKCCGAASALIENVSANSG